MNGPIAEVHTKVERLALKDRPKSTDGVRKYCSLDPFLGDGGKTEKPSGTREFGFSVARQS